MLFEITAFHTRTNFFINAFRTVSVLLKGLFIERVPTLINLIHMLFQSLHDTEGDTFGLNPDAIKDAYIDSVVNMWQNLLK
jgi:hypothetical protein